MSSDQTKPNRAQDFPRFPGQAAPACTTGAGEPVQPQLEESVELVVQWALVGGGGQPMGDGQVSDGSLGGGGGSKSFLGSFVKRLRLHRTKGWIILCVNENMSVDEGGLQSEGTDRTNAML